MIWRMRAREWLGPPPRRGFPGRRVRLQVGLVEIERLYGASWGLTTGERLRRSGVSFFPEADAWRVRLMVPWPWGALVIRVAP